MNSLTNEVATPSPELPAEKLAYYDRKNFNYSVEDINGTVNKTGKSRSNDGSRRWASDDNTFWACSSTYDTIPSGVYKPVYNCNLGVTLELQIVETDDLIMIPNSVNEKIVNEIDNFWTAQEKYKDIGALYKRGVLLWGDPGAGKTSTIQMIIKKHLRERNGIVILGDDPHQLSSALQMIRRVESERLIIVVLEDFEETLERYDQSHYISILDGEIQINNVVYIATTNYPEKLDKRFVDRPSRFDTIIRVEMPDTATRKYFIESKHPNIEDIDIKMWVRKTEDLSISHIKELIIGTYCYGETFDDILNKLLKMRERKLSSEDAIAIRGKVGF